MKNKSASEIAKEIVSAWGMLYLAGAPTPEKWEDLTKHITNAIQAERDAKLPKRADVNRKALELEKEDPHPYLACMNLYDWLRAISAPDAMVPTLQERGVAVKKAAEDYICSHDQGILRYENEYDLLEQGISVGLNTGLDMLKANTGRPEVSDEEIEKFAERIGCRSQREIDFCKEGYRAALEGK